MKISSIHQNEDARMNCLRTAALFLLLAALLFRVAHISGPIDSFSAWRQAETAYMTLRMYEESPPEFLHSKVPYRGGKDVHLAELPVQPLLTAYGYKMLGRESLILARLVTLFFFCAGAGLLFPVMRRLLGPDIAWTCMVVYAWLPLGIGYSRAVHVDFCVLFFSYAYLYCAMRFFETGRWRFWLLSSLSATVAFAMKAPYCFFLGLPLLIYFGWQRNHRTWRSFLLLCSLFVFPLCAAWVFNWHRMALEAGETESLVYCMKWTPELAREAFFGTIAQRFDGGRWVIVLRRLWGWVFTPVGGVLALVGLGFKPDARSWRGVLAVYGWYVGCVVYALTVFAMFSSGHDYYSLPLLAPASMAVSLGIMRLVRRMPVTWLRAACWAVLIAGVAVASMWQIIRTERFSVDQQRLQAGVAIRQSTSPRDLVLSVTKGRSTGWSDPRILYYARRRGWAIELDQLDFTAMELYRKHGARWAALLVVPELYPLSLDEFNALSLYPYTVQPLCNDRADLIGYLVLFDIRTATDSAGHL